MFLDYKHIYYNILNIYFETQCKIFYILTLHNNIKWIIILKINKQLV